MFHSNTFLFQALQIIYLTTFLFLYTTVTLYWFASNTGHYIIYLTFYRIFWSHTAGASRRREPLAQSCCFFSCRPDPVLPRCCCCYLCCCSLSLLLLLPPPLVMIIFPGCCCHCCFWCYSRCCCCLTIYLPLSQFLVGFYCCYCYRFLTLYCCYQLSTLLGLLLKVALPPYCHWCCCYYCCS